MTVGGDRWEMTLTKNEHRGDEENKTTKNDP